MAEEVILCTERYEWEHFEDFKGYKKDKMNNIFSMTEFKEEKKVEVIKVECIDGSFSDQKCHNTIETLEIKFTPLPGNKACPITISQSR